MILVLMVWSLFFILSSIAHAFALDDESLKVVGSLLERLVRIFKGSSDGFALLAQVKLNSGQLREAEALLKTSLEISPMNVKAQCLLADVCLRSGQIHLALETLETALSHDFNIRNLPSFKALKARVLKEKGLFEQCVSLLESILSLPEVKTMVLSTFPVESCYKSTN
jgi:tetratricopeptide (TPR) repeat protein